MDIEGLKKKKNYYDDDEIDENREIEHEWIPAWACMEVLGHIYS